MEEKVKVSFIGMEPSEALKKHAIDKILKHENLFSNMIAMSVYMKQKVYSRGVKEDFVLEIHLTMPRSNIHVKETGADMYAMTDKASDTLFRRLKRYHDKLNQWEGADPWKILEADEAQRALDAEVGNGDADNYTDYVPKIVARNTMEYMSPMSEAEAIERMELGGYTQYMFRRTDGKWCMAYSFRNGAYGIVEQGEDSLS